MLSKNELKEYLDFKVIQYNTPNFIATDPIQIPHRFQKKEDIEISAFLISTIAWGNRVSIIKSGEKLLEIMGDSPYEFIMNYRSSNVNSFVHRTFNQIDLDFFFLSLKNIYLRHNGLEGAFSHNETGDIKSRIIQFRNIFLEIPHHVRSEKHISNPLKNSAAKRLNMFLRWMIRNDNAKVDFGIWKSISPSELYLPLDVHTGVNARALGLLSRKQNDWSALEELMIELRSFDPLDPVKYDFALFGIGAFETPLSKL